MKKRTIVFVRSKVTGRVALVKPTSVLMNSEHRPVVEVLGKDVKFIPIEFDGSDQIFDGCSVVTNPPIGKARILCIEFIRQGQLKTSFS